MSTYYIVSSKDELYHHGVKGMKWGRVRRYQNADGTLTDAGKKRKARQDAADAQYRKKQVDATVKFYDKSRSGGLYGLHRTRGIESNRKRQKILEDRYEAQKIKGVSESKLAKTSNLIKGTKRQIKALEIMKQMELKKVSSLTRDQISKEKMMVGAAWVSSAALTIGVSTLTPMLYVSVPNSQNVRSNMRLSTEERREAISKANRSIK